MCLFDFSLISLLLQPALLSDVCAAYVQCRCSDINMRQPSRPLSPCGNWKAVRKPLFQWRGGQTYRGTV